MSLKKVKSKGKVMPMFSEEDTYAMAREYAEISAQIKALESRKKTLAEKIKQGAESFGVKDDKGSFYLENENFICGKVAKKSFKIDQEKAVEMLDSRGLGDIIDVVTVKKVNEDRLSNAVSEGRISLNDVEEFTEANVSYSVSVKEKEAMPVVEQTHTQSVAKRK